MPGLLVSCALLLAGIAGCGKNDGSSSAGKPPLRGENVVQAVVEKVSRTPDPRKAPYADCLITLQCQLKKRRAGDFDAPEFLAVFPAFQARKLTGAHRFAPGDAIAMSLVPMSRVSGRLQSVMRIDETDDYLSPVYWVEDWRGQGSGPREVSPQNTAPVRPSAMDTAALPPLNRALLAQGPGCVRGQRGEFFFNLLSRQIYRPGFWNLPEGAVFSNGARGALDAIDGFHRQLASRGIALVVVIVPRSTSVFPGLATGLAFDPAADTPPNFPVKNLAARLRENGVHVLNLTDSFIANRRNQETGRPICLPNDDHWSPSGARLAAEETDRFLREFPSLGKLTRPSGSRAYTDVREEEVPLKFHGSLGRYFEDPGTVPDHDTVAFRVTGLPRGDRKESPPPEIVLIGDSFLRMFSEQSAAYPHHLERLLRQPLRVVSTNGGVTAARQILAREVDLSSVRLVIWEMAEDFLPLHNSWRRVPLDRETALAFVNPSLFSKASPSPGEGRWEVVEDPLLGHPEKSLQFSGDSGIRGASSISWSEIGLTKTSVFSATLTAGPCNQPRASNRSRVRFEILVDGNPVASRELTTRQHRETWLRDWEVPVRGSAGTTSNFSLRVTVLGNHAVGFASWRNPELRNARLRTGE